MGFSTEEVREWRDESTDPRAAIYRVYIPARNADHARQLYLEYRDGSDEEALAMLRTGRACATVGQARDYVALARTEGCKLIVFRALGGLA